MIKTVSLETAKLLKEAGFKQDSYFSHETTNTTLDGETYKQLVDKNYSRFHGAYFYISAPTTDELLEELPITIKNASGSMTFAREIIIQEHYIILHYDERCIGSGKCLVRETYETDKYSLPEALAACWLWLKKEGLLTPRQ